MPESKSWFVYMLECSDGSYYTGSTPDLSRRLMVHNSGKGAKYTRSRLPVWVVYSEELKDKSAALRRELEIKNLDKTAKAALIAKRIG